MLKLRDFYYLDQRTVTRFISTIEEGLVKQIKKSNIEDSPKWNFEVSLGILQEFFQDTLGIVSPNIQVDRQGKEEKVLIDITKRPTIDSQYDKLERYLSSVTQSLDELSRKKWSNLEEGQFIHFETSIKLPKGFEMASTFDSAISFYELGKSIDSRLYDKEFEEKSPKIKAYLDKANRSNRTNIYFFPYNSTLSGSHFFFGPIIHSNLEDVELMDMTYGSYKVFGRIDYILDSNEKYTVYDVSQSGVLDLMNREQRRRVKGIDEDIAVTPAIRIKPLAIYKD